MAREQLKTLTEPMYYILLVLLEEQHGYGIMQKIAELTKGRVVIGAGTLYALLSRFEKEGIIEQVREEERKKIYKLTYKGKILLYEEEERLKKLLEDGMCYRKGLKNE
ncbi:PadR family transcriptional regulator [Sporanaerobium hydrogeniformans]|uniref:PadR family transcriptional regulator n=1 Tax=Sporanaerobium hydrogeniformans TaxID=3072179 RepID=A0AC61D9S8_9FIRM|nr:helix-turn-helix transcriptional regulator [Sporanaerobium hydrogeniformans]PHV69520.1 PadR family transcriptional regulator [Sporanaerobium hydrogeniformans]